MNPILQPFLITHGQFSLWGHNPGSIRDQIRRGQLVGLAAASPTGLPASPLPILVVGAGACGCTLALTLASRGRRVTLVDGAPAPFSLQFRSKTRWLDPMEYDWPTGFWDSGVFPAPRNKNSPLGYRADFAFGVAFQLHLGFDQLLRKVPATLDFRPSTFCKGVKQFSATPTRVDCILAGDNNAYTKSFCCIFDCSGVNSEDTSITNSLFTGVSFWANDRLLDSNAGISKENPLVIVSGGGDGALQDALRALTGIRSGKELLQLIMATPGVQDKLKQNSTLLTTLETEVTRRLSWMLQTDDTHGVFLTQHRTLKTFAASIAQTFGSQIVRQLEAHLRSIRLTLVVRCSHFGNAYLLNKFLVLLMAELKLLNIAYGYEIEDIKPLSPHACRTPAECHGQPHQVIVAPTDPDNADCGSQLAERREARTIEPVYCIIIRHGTKNPGLFPRQGSRMSHQILPRLLM